jgi:hypothetical protein
MNSVTNSNMLSLYIPRMGNQYTEQSVYQIFNDLHIGQVLFVDFVAVKDKDAKEDQRPTKFYSAFIQLSHWNIHCKTYAEIQAKKRSDLVVNQFTGEFWMLLPSTVEMLPRLKVNVHQLGAYTNELFTKMANIDKLLELQTQKIKEQGDELEAQKLINQSLIERLEKLERNGLSSISRNLSAEFSETLSCARPPALTRRLSMSSNYSDPVEFYDALAINADRSTSPQMDRTIISNDLCGNL